MTQTHDVSYSELDAIRQCRLKSYLSYHERWQPEKPSAALQRGGLFHKVLEAHYSQKVLTLDSGGLKAVADPWAILKAAEDDYEEDIIDSVRWIYEGYLECYGADEHWEILAVEQRVEEWLRWPNGRKSAYKLKGFVDLLVRDHSAGGGLFVVDHKTARELPKQRALDFDDQMGIYVYLLRKAGHDIRGVIYNACRSYQLKREMSLDERFQRSLTVRTDRELQTMADEALRTFKSAYGERVGGQSEGDKAAILPPRSPNPDTCGWRCSYTEACLMSRKGKDIRGLLSEMGYTQQLKRH